jgi:hypothetical protein
MATLVAKVVSLEGESEVELCSFKQIQQIVDGFVELGWLTYRSERYLVAVNEDGAFKLPENPAEFHDRYGMRVRIFGSAVLMPVNFNVDTLG